MIQRWSRVMLEFVEAAIEALKNYFTGFPKVFWSTFCELGVFGLLPDLRPNPNRPHAAEGVFNGVGSSKLVELRLTNCTTLSLVRMASPSFLAVSPEPSQTELECNKLDLSGQSLKKFCKLPAFDICRRITSLHLDNNELVKLEALDKFTSVVELSASHNKIARMYPVNKLLHLVRLDLSYNKIVVIEGLKELIHLKSLNLACNRVKAIERLQSNLLLEHLDLSENMIIAISNISDLTKLKKLLLHKNHISQLRHAEVYLPKSLETLSLAGNKINDLAEVSHLVNLSNLRELSIVSNPCVEMTGKSPGFDYRPYLINWCLELKVIDGFAVDDIESLKAEWLYSQGRGRKFKPGQQAELVQYLAETCPVNSQSLVAEDERKLRLILSKAHLHQKQLKQLEQSGCVLDKNIADVMTRSLDPALLDSCSMKDDNSAYHMDSDIALSKSLCESLGLPDAIEEEEPRQVEHKDFTPVRAPLPAATKLVPVPESLVSPLVANPPPIPVSSSSQQPVQDMCPADKLATIRHLAQQKQEKKDDSTQREKAALCIQRIWRGYRTRNLNTKVLAIFQHLQIKRTHQYIVKLYEDSQASKHALENEHKLQVLQMQAINALWKKIQELQVCMHEVLRCVGNQNTTVVCSTQTDMTALNTAFIDKTEQQNFRPSSLGINSEVACNSSANVLNNLDNNVESTLNKGVDTAVQNS